jgi:hypothetical protein
MERSSLIKTRLEQGGGGRVMGSEKWEMKRLGMRGRCKRCVIPVTHSSRTQEMAPLFVVRRRVNVIEAVVWNLILLKPLLNYCVEL